MSFMNKFTKKFDELQTTYGSVAGLGKKEDKPVEHAQPQYGTDNPLCMTVVTTLTL
jgi:hypothetical protein